MGEPPDILAVWQSLDIPSAVCSRHPAAGCCSGTANLLLSADRALAILEALLDAEGETVPKAGLLERGWPGTIVEEDAISPCRSRRCGRRSVLLRTGGNGSRRFRG